MAFTKSQLEALKNALLASNQPITAPIHREFAQKIIDELYDAQSRANLLSAIQNDSSLLTTDSVFVIRNGQGFLIPSSQVGGTGSLANLTDTVIIDPQDGEVIIYNSVTEKWENRVAGVVFNDFYVRHDIDNQGLDATQKSNATTNIGAQSILEKGQIDGYASLDGTGRVPSSQLPSFVDDVLEFPTLGDFPETGESGKIYIALDTNKTYRWGGTTYVEISAGVVLGETETTAYRGDRGKIAYDYSQIGHLPLTGGTLASSGSTNTLNIDHASGSGLALNITKGGNGEGLKVVKTSGSGLAASITGGVTLLDELNLTTKLADAHIASADTWNAKIGGTIATGQVAFGTAAGVIGGDSGLTWNNTTKILSATNDAVFNGVNVGKGGGNISTNTRVGVNALLNNTTGSANTANGDSALRNNTTGVNNTANGRGALLNNTTGSANTANGDSALRNNTTGNSNTANGDSALLNNTTGANNTANGVFALFNNTTGGFNTADGAFALFNNTTGGFNTADGLQALFSNTSGSQNTADGALVLLNNTTGSNNVAKGFNAGRHIADGVTPNTITNNSVFIGAFTKAQANNQTNQIVIGTSAIGLGSNTAVLGDDSITFTGLKGNVGVNTTTNAGFRLDVNGTVRIVGATRIDNLAGTGTRMVVADANGVMSTQALGIAGSGTTNYLSKFTDGGTVGDSQVFDNGTNVGIGTTSPGQKLDIVGNCRINGSLFVLNNNSLQLWGIDNGNYIDLKSSDGDFRIRTNLTGTPVDAMRITSGGNILINTDTDAGFKLDVNGTARATAFFTSSDKRKKDIISQDGDLAIYRFKGDDQIHYGYIAQDMEELYPNQVSTDNDGMLSLNYIEILVKKVHDLETKLKKHGLD